MIEDWSPFWSVPEAITRERDKRFSDEWLHGAWSDSEGEHSWKPGVPWLPIAPLHLHLSLGAAGPTVLSDAAALAAWADVEQLVLTRDSFAPTNEEMDAADGDWNKAFWRNVQAGGEYFAKELGKLTGALDNIQYLRIPFAICIKFDVVLETLPSLVYLEMFLNEYTPAVTPVRHDSIERLMVRGDKSAEQVTMVSLPRLEALLVMVRDQAAFDAIARFNFAQLRHLSIDVNSPEGGIAVHRLPPALTSLALNLSQARETTKRLFRAITALENLQQLSIQSDRCAPLPWYLLQDKVLPRLSLVQLGDMRMMMGEHQQVFQQLDGAWLHIQTWEVESFDNDLAFLATLTLKGLLLDTVTHPDHEPRALNRALKKLPYPVIVTN